MRNLILAFGVFALGGCSTTWTHPVHGQPQFYADLAQCQAQAAIMYQPPPPSNYATSYSTCSGYGATYRCTTNTYQQQPLDLSGFSRAFATDGCLMARGYKRE